MHVILQFPRSAQGLGSVQPVSYLQQVTCMVVSCLTLPVSSPLPNINSNLTPQDAVTQHVAQSAPRDMSPGPIAAMGLTE